MTSFYEYETQWELLTKQERKNYDSCSDFYNFCLKKLPQATDVDKNFYNTIIMEAKWYNLKRPYYNVWPSILNLLLETTLEVPLTYLKLPETCLLLKLPKQDDIPFQTMFIAKTDKTNQWFLAFQKFLNGVDEGSWCFYFKIKEGATFQDYVDANDFDLDIINCLHLLCGIILLSNSPEFIQPVVLNKDLEKWQRATPQEREKIAERRVRRTKVRGFHIGKDQETILRNPHFRKPHLATFWTGKGRTTPVVKLRSGSIVKSKKLTTVPTGYIDDVQSR